MEPAEIATILYDLDAIKFGEFTLSSGRSSPYYVDMRFVPGSPMAFRRTIGGLVDVIDKKIGLDSFDSLASVPTGGLVFASALAIESVKPLSYVRSSTKEHGRARKVEGIVSSGDHVLVVDDVITTGGSVLHAIEALQEIGVKITDTLAVIDRLEGAADALAKLNIRLHSVATITDICTALHKQGKIDDAMISKINAHIGTK